MSEFTSLKEMLVVFRAWTDGKAEELAGTTERIRLAVERLAALIAELVANSVPLTVEQRAEIDAEVAAIKDSITDEFAGLDTQVGALEQAGVDPDNPMP